MYVENPNIKCPDDNTIIWRYMNYKKFMSLVERKALYFARSTNQEDKLEGTHSNESENYLDSIINDINPDDENHSKVVDLISGYCNDVKNAKFQSYINCWSASQNESQYMWDKFGKIDRSVCIKSTIHRLKECFISESPIVYIGGIEYIDENEKTPFVCGIRMSELYFFKRNKCIKESEVRAFVGLLSKIKDGNKVKYYKSPIEDGGTYVSVCLNTLIEKIYVSPTSSYEFLDEVKIFVKKTD
jgi:hypothetical protein